MSVFIVMLQLLLMVSTAQIINQGKYISWKPLAVTIAAGILFAFSFRWFGVYTSIPMLLGAFLILYMSERDALKVLGGLSYGTILLLLSDALVTLIENALWFTIGSPAFYAVYAVLLIVFSLAGSIGIRVFKQSVERKEMLDDRLKKLLVYLGVLTVVVYYLCIYLSAYIGETVELIQLNLFFFVVYLLIAFLAFYFYSKSLRKAYEIKQKELQQEAMQRYTQELEQQYTEIRKFRHDHQNILSSLDAFIQEEDFEGLKRYYRHKLKRASEHLAAENFKLENLSRIKVKEIKSIVASKLIRAQELGIDATFEAREDIEFVPADSVAMVRALGILLDNAIEELQEVKSGSMTVGFIRDRKALHIIVQNSCRPDMPRVHKLKEAGFSTKGKNRGLGLASLTELIGQLPNVVSETIVEDGQFKQILVINYT
ncbi:sensor histidine kinase [Saccharibacillus alkalitolerans]|uniref:GHKL domain-containing protein n=1 Tax=Saccharibacillus alkalitolerans TaxID=2705290 RepID=A0ABX0F5L9_9BACL|nr:GHKL domain-containing protein [Saccharibacillus alkalitolerans]NGZ75309.1 GHKL domain-containing protein [Saccharibacillus alkalitolerans]